MPGMAAHQQAPAYVLLAELRYSAVYSKARSATFATRNDGICEQSWGGGAEEGGSWAQVGFCHVFGHAHICIIAGHWVVRHVRESKSEFYYCSEIQEPH